MTITELADGRRESKVHYEVRCNDGRLRHFRGRKAHTPTHAAIVGGIYNDRCGPHTVVKVTTTYEDCGVDR